MKFSDVVAKVAALYQLEHSTIRWWITQVYNAGANFAPKGYELTGEYRMLRDGDSFLNSPFGGTVSTIHTGAGDYGAPRLIVRKIPRKVIGWKFVQGEHRQVRKGDLFIANNEQVDQSNPARFCSTQLVRADTENASLSYGVRWIVNAELIYEE